MLALQIYDICSKICQIVVNTQSHIPFNVEVVDGFGLAGAWKRKQIHSFDHLFLFRNLAL